MEQEGGRAPGTGLRILINLGCNSKELSSGALSQANTNKKNTRQFMSLCEAAQESQEVLMEGWERGTCVYLLQSRLFPKVQQISEKLEPLL